ncbi:Zinc transporter YKE4 [Yarrowia sp. E02]|nr:Zinc transporter YKE4 [Yarrowia sp. E02]
MKLSILLSLPLLVLGHAPKVPSNVDVEYSDSDLFLGSGFNQEVVDVKLADCPIVQYMNEQHDAEHADDTESFIHQMFEFLFPFDSPAYNSILATTYISGPPNLLLALIPPDIRPSSLKIMVAFAVGGLLGDVFLHLLPQVFFGEEGGSGLRFVPVDEKRNIVLGFGIFVGFVSFIVMDKFIRMLGGGHDHGHDDSHGHGHGHKHDHVTETSETITSSAEPSKTTAVKRAEKTGKKEKKEKNAEKKDSHVSSESADSADASSAYSSSVWLNMIADFTHNITDGIALSASFYISKSVGATTFLAVFFHEIPHEVGDFALLIQGGFSKTRAMQAQFLTAVGAYMGTFLGIALNEWGSAVAEDGLGHVSTLLGTSVTWGDLALPFTAGSFLYIGTVGVVPELLEEDEEEQGQSVGKKLVDFAGQLVAMLVGIGIMFVISWNE